MLVLSALLTLATTGLTQDEPATTTPQPTSEPDAASVAEREALASLPWPADAPAMIKAAVAGSWTPGETGFDEQYVDEADLLELPRSMRAGRRHWVGTVSSGDVLFVDALTRDRQGPAVAYAFAYLTLPESVPAPEGSTPAVVHIRHRGRLQLRVDGVLVADAHPRPDGAWQTLRVPVTLQGGDDVFLVKCGRGSPELGTSMDYELRVTDRDGRPLEQRYWQTLRIRPQ